MTKHETTYDETDPACASGAHALPPEPVPAADSLPASPATPKTPRPRKRPFKPRAPRPTKAEVAKRRHGLVAGGLPVRYRLASAQANQFRRGLELAVIERRGEVSIVDAAHISTATRFERAALVSTWIFREQHEDLDAMERIDILNKIAVASANRDKSIEKLRLPVGNGIDNDSLADFYAEKPVTPFDPVSASLRPPDKATRDVSGNTGRPIATTSASSSPSSEDETE
jgi:hypothetical protein